MLWHTNKNWEERAQAVPMGHYLPCTATPKGVQQCQEEFSWPRDMVADGPRISELVPVSKDESSSFPRALRMGYEDRQNVHLSGKAKLPW